MSRASFAARPGAALALTASLATLLSACGLEDSGIYAYPDDTGVVCGLGIDHEIGTAHDLEPGLDRARREGSIIQLYAHAPGVTVPVSRIEGLVAAAADRGMGFATYRELAEGTARGGSLALGFDDAHVEGWHALRPVLDHHGARVTFFVTRYPGLDQAKRVLLRELADDGHDIQYHGTGHRNARAYVEDHGMDAYIEDEIEPGLAAMRADGHDPVVFAYPFGERSDDLDDELLRHFPMIRASQWSCEG